MYLNSCFWTPLFSLRLLFWGVRSNRMLLSAKFCYTALSIWQSLFKEEQWIWHLSFHRVLQTIDHGLDDRASIPVRCRDYYFCRHVQTTLRAHSASCPRYTKALSFGVKLTTSLHYLQSFRMNGDLPLLPHTPSWHPGYAHGRLCHFSNTLWTEYVTWRQNIWWI